MSPAIILQARIAIEDHKDEVTTVIPLTPRSLSWFDLHSTVCWHCDRPFQLEEHDVCDAESESDTESENSENESEEEDSDENDSDSDESEEEDSDKSSQFMSRPPLPFVLKVNSFEATQPDGSIEELRAYTADGYFCSFRCAKGWGIENGYKSNPSFTNSNALFFKDVVKGGTISQYLSISPAPPRRALRRYGGPLSYEEFDNFTDRRSHITEPTVQILSYPTISMRHQYLEEIRFEDIDNPTATNTIILEQNSDIINRRKRKRMSLIMSPSHLQLNNRMQELQRRSRQP